MDTTFNKYRSFQTGVDKTYFPVRGYTLSLEESMKQMKPNGDIDMETRGFFYNYEKQRWIFYYPQEFVNPSEHDKYIIFQYCRCSVNDHYNAEIEVHASFIPRDQYCDHLVYYANLQVPDDNRKYKVNTNQKMGFEVWFTDGTGKLFEKDDRINFVMFLKLLY